MSPRQRRLRMPRSPRAVLQPHEFAKIFAASWRRSRPPSIGMKPDLHITAQRASDRGAKRPTRLPRPGHYAVEVPPSRVTPFKTSKTRGVLCVVRIARGPHAGRDVSLRFLFEGPGRMVERDLGVLAKWRRLVGAPPAGDPAGVIEALGRASAGRMVILRLEHDKPWLGAVRAFAADVLVDDASAP